MIILTNLLEGLSIAFKYDKDFEDLKSTYYSYKLDPLTSRHCLRIYMKYFTRTEVREGWGGNKLSLGVWSRIGRLIKVLQRLRSWVKRCAS